MLWQEVKKRLQKTTGSAVWAPTIVLIGRLGFSSSGSEWYNPIDEVRDKSGRNWIDDKLQLSEDEWDDLIDVSTE